MEYNHQYNATHKEQRAASAKKYRESHKDLISAKDKKYRETNKEKIALTSKKYRDSHKESKAEKDKIYCENNKEKVAQKRREYKEAHRTELAAKQREYGRIHKDILSIKQKERRAKIKARIVAESKKYYMANKEKVKDKVKTYSKTPIGRLTQARSMNKRRSKSEMVNNDLTIEQWNKILNLQNNRCLICKRKFNSHLKPTRDHIIPVSKGGGLTFENTQALCRSCNSSKSAKLDKGLIVVWTGSIASVAGD